MNISQLFVWVTVSFPSIHFQRKPDVGVIRYFLGWNDDKAILQILQISIDLKSKVREDIDRRENFNILLSVLCMILLFPFSQKIYGLK